MKNRTLYVLSTLLILCALLMGACAPAAVEVAEVDQVEEPAAAAESEAAAAPASPPAEESSAVTIQDSAGNLVELESLPQRVVVAGKATPFTLSTTYVFEEASDRIVALELRRGLLTAEFLTLIDPKYEQKIKLEMESSAEQIAPVEPDIVITKNYVVKSLKESLDPLGIPVVGLNMETPDVFYQDIEMLGQLFGAPERAQAVNAFLQEKVNVVKTAMQGLTEADKPSVLVIQYSQQDGEVAFKVPPASYIQTTMVIDGGGIPAWAEQADEEESNWIVVNFEQIAAWDPDVILVIDYNGNPQETAAMLKQNDLWKELKAVQADKVFGFGKDYQGWDLPDPRWILGYTWVATKLQPERMAGVDMTEMVKEFYRFMYRLSDEQIEASILPMVYAD